MPPTRPNAMYIFSHQAFQEEEFIGLSSATQGLNVVIYKKPTGAQKKQEKPFWCCQRVLWL